MIRSLPDLDFDPEGLTRLCQKWRIAELAVFGSAARGEMRPDSDIDLMVEFEPGSPWSAWGLVDLKRDFEELFGRPIDLVEKGTIRNPYRLKSIERDLRVVYAT